MRPGDPVGVREATPSEADLVAWITAQAFADDPVTIWAIGRGSAANAMFGILARYFYLPRGGCDLVGHAAASMWLAPDADPAFDEATGARLASALANAPKGTSARLRRLTAATIHRRPAAPHFYLGTIGATGGRRGSGVGYALLSALMTRADEVAAPIYLESTNPANRSFYERNGFIVTDRFQPSSDAPVIDGMLRAANGQEKAETERSRRSD